MAVSVAHRATARRRRREGTLILRKVKLRRQRRK